jgi:hypothetical protein
MTREKIEEKRISAEENLRLWEEALKNYKPELLTLKEKLAIDRMMLTRKRSQEIVFIPGEEIKAVGVGAMR